MNGYFNNQGFNTYYLNSSKYSRKNELLNSFYYTWYECVGWGLAAGELNTTSKIKVLWKADLKKRMKIKLQGQGYSPAGIEGLFKSFAAWNKANPY